jgi:RNA polymerase sigma-70 factor (ECF subfamily)
MAAVPTLGRADRATAVRPASADAYAEVLYERLYDRIFGYCLYQLGSREEAEDAAQVTFVQALRGLRRGIVPRVEAAWVFAIAKNVCLERHQVRGRRRSREVLLDPADLDLEAVEDEWHGEEAAQLRQALEHLPESQREAVLLREWRGLSYREIATEMGLSLSAVETLIFRARRSLARELSETTGRSGVARGLLFGPLAAAFKIFGGSAAKVAVAAALAAAAVTGGVLVGDTAEAPRRPAVKAPVVLAPEAELVFQRPAAAAHVAPQTERERGGKSKGANPGADGRGTAKSGNEPGQENGAGPVGGVAEPIVAPVLEPVDPLVTEVEKTLEPVLDLVPQLPLQLP